MTTIDHLPEELMDLFSKINLQNREKDVCQILFNNGPLTISEIQARGQFPTPNSAQAPLSVLTHRGLVKVNHKNAIQGTTKVNTYSLVLDNISSLSKDAIQSSGFSMKTSKSRLSAKCKIPTSYQLTVCVKELNILLSTAKSSGARITPELKLLQKWLAEGAPCRHDNSE